jgi:hypothetical protein
MDDDQVPGYLTDTALVDGRNMTERSVWESYRRGDRYEDVGELLRRLAMERAKVARLQAPGGAMELAALAHFPSTLPLKHSDRPKCVRCGSHVDIRGGCACCLDRLTTEPVRAKPDGETPDSFHRHATGATRSADADAVRYDLIPTEPLRRLAARYALGAETHGERNWELGLPVGDTINHLIRHLEHWRESLQRGERDADDHLAAVAWGAFALMHFEPDYFAAKAEAKLPQSTPISLPSPFHADPPLLGDWTYSTEAMPRDNPHDPQGEP